MGIYSTKCAMIQSSVMEYKYGTLPNACVHDTHIWMHIYLHSSPAPLPLPFHLPHSISLPSSLRSSFLYTLSHSSPPSPPFLPLPSFPSLSPPRLSPCLHSFLPLFTSSSLSSLLPPSLHSFLPLFTPSSLYPFLPSFPPSPLPFLPPSLPSQQILM